MATNEQIVDALTPLAQQYGYDPDGFAPRALETLDALDAADGADEPDEPAASPLDELSVNELRSMAKELGVDTDGTKAELRARIEAAADSSAQ